MRKRGGPQRNNVVPKHVAAMQVFSPLYKIISDIRSGMVDEAIDESGSHVIMSINPAFNEFRHTLFPASKYLKQWCHVWANIGKHMKEEIPMTALLDVADRLTQEELVFEEKLLNQAKLEIDAQKSVWYRVPKPIMDKALAES